MKITIFSGNQPRHLSLVENLSKISDDVFFVSEVQTVFPGQISDRFQTSKVMNSYFSKVVASEKRLFGEINFLPRNVKTLSIKLGDLSWLEKTHLIEALSSDVFIVFGSSYIKGWLADFLIHNKAINIHMGLSPYYRGSACNFWASYDNNLGYVGATIHYLSKGLDSGNMLFHCLPNFIDGQSTFDFTMRAVAVAHKGLLNAINDGTLASMEAVAQDHSKNIRYSRSEDFNDQVAEKFLNRNISLSPCDLAYPNLINPVFG